MRDSEGRAKNKEGDHDVRAKRREGVLSGVSRGR